MLYLTALWSDKDAPLTSTSWSQLGIFVYSTFQPISSPIPSRLRHTLRSASRESVQRNRQGDGRIELLHRVSWARPTRTYSEVESQGRPGVHEWSDIVISGGRGRGSQQRNLRQYRWRAEQEQESWRVCSQRECEEQLQLQQETHYSGQHRPRVRWGLRPWCRSRHLRWDMHSTGQLEFTVSLLWIAQSPCHKHSLWWLRRGQDSRQEHAIMGWIEMGWDEVTATSAEHITLSPLLQFSTPPMSFSHCPAVPTSALLCLPHWLSSERWLRSRNNLTRRSDAQHTASLPCHLHLHNMMYRSAV